MDIEIYSQKHSQFYGDRLPPSLAEHFRSVGPGTCIDVGCGDGRTLYALQAEGLLAGVAVTAVDLSPQRVDTAARISPDFRCVVASACDLAGVADASMDFLISAQVIEHVPDDRQMLREVHRVLRPGGSAYVSTVFKKRWAWYFRRCNGKWTLDPTHVREYTSDHQLLSAASGAGLAVVDSRKRLIAYPLIDPVLRLVKVSRLVFQKSRLLRALRLVKLPILGYYEWELVLQRPLADG